MIIEQINHNVAESMKAGWKPKILLINPHWKRKLIAELWTKYGLLPLEVETYMDLKITEADVADFQVIDNRSWIYQKF